MMRDSFMSCFPPSNPDRQKKEGKNMFRKSLGMMAAAVAMLSGGYLPPRIGRETNLPAAQRAGRRKKAISMAQQKRAEKKRRNKLSRGR
jgi:hypothetical protein